MRTLCTIQASSASESTQAEPLGRHERKFCAEKAVAPFLSERPRLRTVKIGSKSTYRLIITVGFWRLRIVSAATVWAVAELNSISEFNEAFDLPELHILYLQKKIKNQIQICLGEEEEGRKEEEEKGNEKED